MEIQNTYIKISKNIIYCFIVLIFIACQNKQRNEFDYKLIEKISPWRKRLACAYKQKLIKNNSKKEKLWGAVYFRLSFFVLKNRRCILAPIVAASPARGYSE